MGSQLWGPPQGLPRAGPFAIEICSAEGISGEGLQKLKFCFLGPHRRRQDYANSPGGKRIPGFSTVREDSRGEGQKVNFGTAREAPRGVDAGRREGRCVPKGQFR